MGSHESEECLVLLKELALIKELDNEFEAGPQTEREREDHRLRQQRQQEIAEEIKALAEQKKSADSQTSDNND